MQTSQALHPNSAQGAGLRGGDSINIPLMLDKCGLTPESIALGATLHWSRQLLKSFGQAKLKAGASACTGLKLNLPKGSFFKKGDVVARVKLEGGGGEGGTLKKTYSEKDVVAPISGNFFDNGIHEGEKLSDFSISIGIMYPCEHTSVMNDMCISCGQAVSVSECKRQKMQGSLIAGKHIYVTENESKIIEERRETAFRSSKKLALSLDLDNTLLHASDSRAFIQEMEQDSNDLFRVIVSEKPDFKYPIKAGMYLYIGDATMTAYLPAKVIEVLQTKSATGWNESYHVVYEDGRVEQNVSRRRLATNKEYSIKCRPHLHHFLEVASQFCQLSVYTNGVRGYAEAVVKRIDPNNKYFNGRIVTRSDVVVDSSENELTIENNRETIKTAPKDLSNIFQKDIRMVLVLDDRIDVWKESQLNHILQVKPYYYHKFLSPPPASAKSSNIPAASHTSHQMSHLISLLPSSPSSKSPASSSSSSSSSLASSLASLASESSSYSSSSSSSSMSNTSNSSTLSEGSLNDSEQQLDFDDQLLRSLEIIKEINARFFAESKELTVGKELTVPKIIKRMKSRVLSGCNIVFSGLILKHIDPRDSDLWKLATSLGACCELDITAKTTHLISSTDTTEKAKLCNKRGRVWVLSRHWLLHCNYSMSRVVESHFSLFPILDSFDPPVISEEINASIIDSSDEDNQDSPHSTSSLSTSGEIITASSSVNMNLTNNSKIPPLANNSNRHSSLLDGSGIKTSNSLNINNSSSNSSSSSSIGNSIGSSGGGSDEQVGRPRSDSTASGSSTSKKRRYSFSRVESGESSGDSSSSDDENYLNASSRDGEQKGSLLSSSSLSSSPSSSLIARRLKEKDGLSGGSSTLPRVNRSRTSSISSSGSIHSQGNVESGSWISGIALKNSSSAFNPFVGGLVGTDKPASASNNNNNSFNSISYSNSISSNSNSNSSSISNTVDLASAARSFFGDDSDSDSDSESDN